VRIARIALQDFRNYESLDIGLTAGLTVLVGRNGQGKTNLLEAVMLCSRMRSPRTDQLRDAIRWGADTAALHLEADSDGRPRKVDATIGPRGLAVKVNGQTPRRRADAAGAVLAVMFTPDDLRLVKDEPERRRAFLDGVLAVLRPAQAGLPSDYSRAMRQRNALLKRAREEEAALKELGGWDEQLVRHGSALATARADAAARLAERARSHHADLTSGEELDVHYSSRVLEEGGEAATVEATFRRLLAERRRDEIVRGITLVGPHRDDLVLTLSGHSAREFASQGQQRSIALALKLAELGAVGEARQESPVLLLDDVMSELDETRRAALARALAGLEQTMVTTTTPEYFASALDVPVRWLALSGGNVSEGAA
jgi:DNA replication and repair protein RecF